MRRTYSRRARCSQNLRTSPNQITTVCRMSRASSEVRPIIYRPFCEPFAYVLRHSHIRRENFAQTSQGDSIVARHSGGGKFSEFWTAIFSTFASFANRSRAPWKPHFTVFGILQEMNEASQSLVKLQPDLT